MWLSKSSHQVLNFLLCRRPLIHFCGNQELISPNLQHDIILTPIRNKCHSCSPCTSMWEHCRAQTFTCNLPKKNHLCWQHDAASVCDLYESPETAQLAQKLLSERRSLTGNVMSTVAVNLTMLSHIMLIFPGNVSLIFSDRRSSVFDRLQLSSSLCSFSLWTNPPSSPTCGHNLANEEGFSHGQTWDKTKTNNMLVCNDFLSPSGPSFHFQSFPKTAPTFAAVVYIFHFTWTVFKLAVCWMSQ